jgi:hypothetical protein
LAFAGVFIGEKLRDATECICTDVFDKFFEFLVVLGCEFARMGVDDFDKGVGFLTEELIEFFKVVVHFWYGLYHGCSI